MEIKISSLAYEGDPFYRGAVLHLPASKLELLDAMDIARIRKGEAMKISITDFNHLFLNKYADIEHADFEELNLLARELHRNYGVDRGRYENAIAIYATEQKDGLLSCKDLINALFNMDRFDFYPGIYSLKTLGEHTLDEGLEALMGPIPDEVYPLLDLEKLGSYAKEQEGGVFTSSGYGVRCRSGWDEVYPGLRRERQEQEKPTMIAVYLENDKCMESGSKLWLELPCEKAEMERVRGVLRAQRPGDLQILKTRSQVPHLKYLIDTGEDLEKLNQLAKELAKLEPEELTKYKAVLEYLDEESLTEAIGLIERLDAYAVCPEHLSYGDCGRAYLQKQGIDCTDPAFLGFDFEAYGKRKCEEEGIILTSYGSITCVKEQVEEQIEKQTEASLEEPTEALGKGAEREEGEFMDLRMGM